MQGAQECTLTAEADLAITTHRQPWSRPPIQVDFSGELSRAPISLLANASVVMFTASGLLVRFLKVFEKSGYQSVKWVRYLSKANGSYQIRVSFGLCVKRAVLMMISFDVSYVCCYRMHDLDETAAGVMAQPRSARDDWTQTQKSSHQQFLLTRL